MILPDFSREESLARKGYKMVAGVDEAGRGPLAGPVVAAAVVFENSKELAKDLARMGVRDSKMVSPKKRESLYDFIVDNSRSWAAEVVSEKVIDKINILNATKLAMRGALEKLGVRPDFILIDGNATLEDFPVSQLAIPRADQYVFSVSAASIIAKVTRDRILLEMDEKYPGYGFSEHKGYGTKFHMEVLKEKGPCEIHRRSFSPIKELLGLMGVE
ncbi:MAG: ribonuclease HII [Candidatus Pacebacteria bacterium]|nr:ribonuclease HII [Candidatus Paceibacterota bacterium]